MAGKPARGKVVVYDDEHYYMGSVLAEQLVKQGHEVTLVTPNRELSQWTDYTLEIDKILNRMATLNIPVHTDYALQQGDETQLTLESTLGTDRLHLIGDALVPGIIQAAVFSGHKTARSILATVNGETEYFKLERPDIGD